jgi:hypothetical protein
MSITDGYATLQEVKDWQRITTGAQDALIEAIITATSRSIDSATGHNFYPKTDATARVFTASDLDLVEVDDFWDAATLVLKTDEDADGTFEYTWAATDYQLEPLNNLAKDRAVWRIRRKIMGDYLFPVSNDSLVQVTAKWGWEVVPEPVKIACRIQANRLANRRDSPLGVVVSPDFGTDRLASFDPDVRDLLRPFMRYEVPL